jgi:hypothetical protein
LSCCVKAIYRKQLKVKQLFVRIEKHNLIDWAVMFQGVKGVPSVLEPLTPLTATSMRAFINKELENMTVDDSVFEIVIELEDKELSSFDLCSKLQKICELRYLDTNLAKRIWRLVALEEMLENLESDPLQGLINLSYFWAAWEWPSDAPQAMFNLSAHDYSIENYERIIDEHHQWLKSELVYLKN